MPENKKNNFFHSLLFTLYLIFLFSLVFSFRAISSISVGAIALAGLITNTMEQKPFFNPRLNNPFFIACCLLFLVELLSLAYTSNMHEGWKNIWGKSVLIAIPFGLCCCNYITGTTRHKMLKWYCAIVFGACAFAVYRACGNYVATNDTSVFFYHQLVSLYSGHAIQFSILVIVALVYLFESSKRHEPVFIQSFHVFLMVFLSLFLFLLSSKLVLAFYIFYLFYFLASIFRLKTRSKTIAVLLIAGFAGFCIILFGTSNSVSRRFHEIARTDFSFFRRDRFDPGNYFNGLQFRLLQWRFVPEILAEKKSWVAGVGIGDAQSSLNKKYISEHMYTGTTERGDKGFLGYNTHNEFLEALLQAGIIGLVSFLLVCFALIKMISQRKRAEVSFITILLLAYGFSESVFESQYSSFIFLFFPLFFYLNGDNHHS